MLIINAKGAVTITFSKVGMDVVATTSGSMLAPVPNTFTTGSAFGAGVNTLYHYDTAPFSATNEYRDGAASAPTITVTPSSASGDPFGFIDNVMYFDEFILSGEELSPSTTWVWSNNTLSGIGLGGLVSGSVIAYTTGDAEAIVFATDVVPEPSSSLFGPIALSALLLRKQRNTIRVNI